MEQIERLLSRIANLEAQLQRLREEKENGCMDYEWQLTRLMDAAEAAFDDFEEQINQYNELSAAAGAQVTPLSAPCLIYPQIHRSMYMCLLSLVYCRGCRGLLRLYRYNALYIRSQSLQYSRINTLVTV